MMLQQPWIDAVAQHSGFMANITQPAITSLGSDWLKKIEERHPDTRVAGYWEAISNNSSQWAGEVSAGPYWAEVRRRLQPWSTEYYGTTKSDLLESSTLKAFSSKSEASIKDKVLRKCNEKPERLDTIIGQSPPIPDINDLVRTRVVCKYVDGVEFLATRLAELAKEQGCLIDRSREGRLEGYFAQHVVLKHSVFYRIGGAEIPTTIGYEVQVATEMATHMWDGGHFVYEQERGAPEEPWKWQWAPNDTRFIANQLGHMLHLADGLLLQLRDKAKSRKN